VGLVVSPLVLVMVTDLPSVLVVRVRSVVGLETVRVDGDDVVRVGVDGTASTADAILVEGGMTRESPRSPEEDEEEAAAEATATRPAGDVVVTAGEEPEAVGVPLARSRCPYESCSSYRNRPVARRPSSSRRSGMRSR
jgi:hypothetical protein